MFALHWPIVLGLNVIEVTRIEGVCARSLIRAWHKLHVERLVTHDFTDLLAPRHAINDNYYAAVRRDDVRAILITTPRRENQTEFQVVGVAHAPGEIESACSLISELATTEMVTLVEKLPARWKYEATFAREDASK